MPMHPVPGPDALRDTLRAALAAERAEDRSLNRERSLDRPARVLSAHPQAGGTTVLALERPVRLVRGAEIVLAGAAGTRATTVVSAEAARVEVDGAHADARQVLGRPLHLSATLESALEAALSARSGVVAAAAGWEPGRPGRRPGGGGAQVAHRAVLRR